ncbi:hypothetical protein MMC19_000272 [Ptychographa xylographoides]|nr:hypothetical protein [Ptychographa xylographoides]
MRSPGDGVLEALTEPADDVEPESVGMRAKQPQVSTMMRSPGDGVLEPQNKLDVQNGDEWLRAFERELSASKTMDQIRRAALHNNYVVAEYKTYSKMAFTRLLEADSSVPTLIEFLEDRKLNAPGAENLRAFIKWPELQARPSSELQTLNSWLEKQIAFGLLSENDIQTVLHAVRRRKVDSGSSLSSRLFCWTVCKSVWGGVQASAIDTTSELHQDTLELLFEATLLSPSLVEGRRTAKSLLMSAKLLETESLDSRLVPSIIRLSGARASGSTLDGGSEDGNVSFSWLIPVIHTLPKEASSRLLSQITSTLTERAEKRTPASNSLLSAWFDALKIEDLQTARQDAMFQTEWLQIEKCLISLDLEHLASYLRFFDDRERCTFLLRYWIPQRLVRELTKADPAPKSEQPPVYYKFPSTTWSNFVGLVDLSSHYPGGGGAQCYIDMIRMLREHHPTLLPPLLTDLFFLLRSFGHSHAIVDIVKLLTARRSPDSHSHLASRATTSHAVTSQLPTSLPLALAIFKADARLRLEHCPGLAEALIAHPAPSAEADEPLALLARDPALLGSTSRNFRPTSPLRVTDRRVALLHRMALAYAAAPHLSPAQAYRKVKRCVDFFRDRPDLLGPDMARALAHAGVLRYLQEGLWVSTVRHTYVLGFVRALEGEDVAAQLDAEVWEWRRRNVRLERREEEKEEGGGE